jgi:hypothetical protein
MTKSCGDTKIMIVRTIASNVVTEIVHYQIN